MARNGSDTRGSFKYGQVYIYGWLGMALTHVALSSMARFTYMDG